MTCEELAQHLPDLLDGTLTSPTLEEAQAALEKCPECQKDLEAARNIRAMLVKLQAGNSQFRPSPNFEANLYARIRHQKHGLALLDLSSRSFGLWFIELINIAGHLLNQGAQPKPGQSSS